MTNAVITVQNLSKDFDGQRVVRDLSFTLAAGEALGLLGPNGAGKTTTLQMLLGLIRPTGGTIEILGRSLPRDRTEILSQVNSATPYTALPGNLKVRQNLEIFARLYQVADYRQRLHELCELLEIGELLEKRTAVLSSGQQARVNLCRALINNPRILFLDEPTVGLDPEIARKIRTVLKHIQTEKGVALLYTSHNMPEVEQMCDRVLFLARGRLVLAGSPAELRRRAKTDSLEEIFVRLSAQGDLIDLAEAEP